MQATGDELVAVRLWIFDRLREHFDEGQATALAEAGADYHRALELFAAGCPPELVVSILT